MVWRFQGGLGIVPPLCRPFGGSPASPPECVNGSTVCQAGTTKSMSSVTKTAIKASNGFIHVIDAAIPPE